MQVVLSTMRENLIGEYRLLVNPVVRGSGKRLLEDGSKATLKQVQARPTRSGAGLLRYEQA